MKMTVSRFDFIDSFQGGYKDHFSYDGKVALFEYFEELEESCDMEIELDPIGFCCEYFEYENLVDFHNDYDKQEYPTMEKVEDNTPVIPINGTERFIIQKF